MIQYRNVEIEAIKNCFISVVNEFSTLHGHLIILNKTNIKSTTMQAQPILNKSFFSKKKRSFRVDYRETTLIHEDIKVKDLPYEVLQGWFAHELGHIVDYQERSGWDMIKFGINYLISDRCKTGAEKRADYYALQNGFKNEILAMKKYLIDHAHIDEKYKKRIKKYYASPEEIEHLILEHGL